MRRRFIVSGLAVAVLLAALGTALSWARTESPGRSRAEQKAAPAPKGSRLAPSVISFFKRNANRPLPPGKRQSLVYCHSKSGGGLDCALWRANIDGSDPTKLTAPGDWPVISPDGRFIVFQRGREQYATVDPPLYLMTLTGRKTVLLERFSRTNYPLGWEWSPDSKRLLVNEVDGLRLIDFSRGITKLIVPIRAADRSEITINADSRTAVSFSPNGRLLAYTLETKSSACMYLLYLQNWHSRQLICDRGRSPNWGQPVWGLGGIVFNRNAVLWIVDPGTGATRRLAGTAQFTAPMPLGWSRDGRWILGFDGVPGPVFWKVDTRTGRVHELGSAGGNAGPAAVSRDGQSILTTPEQLCKVIERIPASGRKPRVIARNACEPTWNLWR